MYNIKQAAARTGLTVPVLRAWERRYGIVSPARTPSGYRVYDDEAIARVQAMRRLVDAGWAPSTAAAAILAGTAPAEPDPEPAVAGVPVEPSENDAFVEAAARLDSDGVEAILDEMFARGSFERIADDYLMPAVVALGDAWAHGRIDVAAEHLASHAVLRRLAAAYQAAGRPNFDPGGVIVGLPPGSRHELGALAFGVAARRAGLRVLYLGPDLPIDDWVATAERVGARAAVIGSVTAADRGPARRVALALREALPGIVVAFGGKHPPGRPPASDGSGADGAPGPWIRLPERLDDAVRTLAAEVGPGPTA
ncbi:MAG TPA: MerR family transcriptional regulator [Candidatus Limnocylindrales bacterium]|nr:MerR family transcriptional regulator [Candidatus Limnocylindrales bacterium]HEU4921097.1 MerR family transcriptional regulator [Candidatus Limnocylindrales bacterium]